MDHQTWNLGGEFEQTNLQKFKCSGLPGERGRGDYGSLKLIDASCSFCPFTVLVKLRVELFSLNSDTLTRCWTKVKIVQKYLFNQGLFEIYM